jgi:hypothetical protein
LYVLGNFRLGGMDSTKQKKLTTKRITCYETSSMRKITSPDHTSSAFEYIKRKITVKMRKRNQIVKQSGKRFRLPSQQRERAAF